MLRGVQVPAYLGPLHPSQRPEQSQRLSCLDKPQRAVSHQRGALGDGAEACQCTNTGRSSGYGCKPASSRLGDAERDRDDFIASPT